MKTKLLTFPLLLGIAIAINLVAPGCGGSGGGSAGTIRDVLLFNVGNDVYIANYDGTGARNLTEGDYQALQATPNPDGETFAFEHHDGFGNYNIYSVKGDGSALTPLTLSDEDHAPQYSPDGSKIVFSSERDGNSEVYSISADGSSPTNLTNHSSQDFDPSWSPDGSKIVFRSNRSGDSHIYVMDANGANVVQLTNTVSLDSWPAFSPDGSKIVFNRGANLWIMDSDGTDATPLTSVQAGEGAITATFTPDGTKITYVFYFGKGERSIYTMDLNGSNKAPLVELPGDEGSPRYGQLRLKD